MYFARRKDAINACVASTMPDSNSRQSWKERNRLAREWFQAADQDVQESCAAEADRIHEEEMEAWEMSQVQGDPTPESQKL